MKSNCASGDHTVKDHILTDRTTCNADDPQPIWLVVFVLGLTALWDSIADYIGPSPRERERNKREVRVYSWKDFQGDQQFSAWHIELPRILDKGRGTLKKGWEDDTWYWTGMDLAFEIRTVFWDVYMWCATNLSVAWSFGVQLVLGFNW